MRRCLHGLWSVSCESSNRKTLVCIKFHMLSLLIHYVDDWCQDALCVMNCHHIHSKHERKLSFRSAVPIKPSKILLLVSACLSVCSYVSSRETFSGYKWKSISVKFTHVCPLLVKTWQTLQKDIHDFTRKTWVKFAEYFSELKCL